MKELFESALYRAVAEFAKECGTVEDYAAAVRARGKAIIRRALDKCKK